MRGRRAASTSLPRALLLLLGASFVTASSMVGAQKPPVQPPQVTPQIPPQVLSLFPPGVMPPGGLPLPPTFPRWTPMAPPSPTVTAQSVATPAAHRTLQAHLLRPEATLLESSAKRDQLRGVVRAASGTSKESTALLLELWTGRSRVLRDAEIMTAFTRGLARRRGEPRVRDALASILGTWAPVDGSQATHTRLVRYTAALALAEDGSDESVRSLFAALERDPTEQAARAALLRFPPKARVYFSPSQLSPRLLSLLEELGDLRYADDILRGTSSAKPETRAAAFHAAASTPDTRAADIARRSLVETAPRVRAEATFALLKLHAKDGEVLVGNLLKDEPTALRGAQLAQLLDSDAMAKRLGESLVKYKDPEIRSMIFESLSQSRTEGALDVLSAAIASAELRTDATRALGLSEAPGAGARIERLASRGGPGDLVAAIQAYTLRMLLHGNDAASSPMNDRIVALAAASARAEPASQGREELAPAWFALAVLGKGPKAPGETTRAFVTNVPPAGRRAFAAALSFLPARSPAFLREWLVLERDNKTIHLLVAASLSHPETAGILSRKDVFARATSMGVEAPLAAQVWVSDATQENGEEEQVRAFLHGPSANLRAAAALGLRSGKLRNAIGLLTDAYDPEPDADVRTAIISSLEVLLRDRREDAIDKGTTELLANVVAYDPELLPRNGAERARANLRAATMQQSPVPTRTPRPAANTFATLVSLTDNDSSPLALYVAPGPVFRVVAFAHREAIVGGISDQMGHLNLAVELP